MSPLAALYAAQGPSQGLAELPVSLQLGCAGVLGLLVGSFLNVAIHRLPEEGLGINEPKRSFCPSCKHQLAWSENLPLLSWLRQRGRCKHCGVSISWRYPLVEALTGALYALVAWITPFAAWPLLLVQLLIVSGLIVATFVDFDRFEIPDEVSLGGLALCFPLSFLVPALHADTWMALELAEAGDIDRFHALLAAIAGAAAGGGILLLIGWLGKLAFGRDAMGLGDVKLLAAGGGFIGPGGALVALVLASVLASVAGIANMARFACISARRGRARGQIRGWKWSLRTGRVAGRYVPFGPYLGMGIGIVLLAWNHVRELFLS